MDEKTKSRRFTLNQRIAIIAEYEVAEMGQRGAVLRRHEITSPTMTRWRKQKRAGLLEPSDKTESRMALSRVERAAFIRMQADYAALEARLAQSEGAVEVLGKASALLEALAKSARPAPAEDSPEPPAWGQRYQP
jgi:transposase-like protein